jgi:hypothetical protein
MQTLQTVTFVFPERDSYFEPSTQRRLVIIHWILMSGPDRFTLVSEFTPLRNERSFLVSDGSLYESMYDTQTTPLNHSDAAADLGNLSRLVRTESGTHSVRENDKNCYRIGN